MHAVCMLNPKVPPLPLPLLPLPGETWSPAVFEIPLKQVKGHHLSTIHSTVGDEESSVDINEHDQETSPASGSEADIQRSNTDHHDQMIEDEEDISELKGEELLQSF